MICLIKGVQSERNILENVEDVLWVAGEGEDEFVLDGGLGWEDCHGLAGLLFEHVIK